MIEQQPTTIVTREELVSKAKEFDASGYRLVQIGCTALNTGVVEVNYSFDRDYNFENLRIILSSEDLVLPSISSVYFSAFLYENEIHDLFGVNVENMVLDFKGTLYKTSEQFPFKQKQ